MRPAEIHALGELIGDGLAAGGALVAEMHEGIAGRPFGSLGPAAAPVKLIHDGVSEAVYIGVRSGLRGLARGCARVAAHHAPPDDHPLSGGLRGSLILGALNGLYGHHLAQRNSELALEMELRCRGTAVPPRRARLESTFPTATARVVVFVHCLCETDESWRVLRLRGERFQRRDYGERLAENLDFTPVYLRYNTGQHVSDNGRRMAEILDALVTEWPVEPRELVLVGHSMDGLVARSACRYGEHQRACFTHLVKHVFCLGTPHLGADLEKAANVLGHALGRLPETRGLAKVLNARSVTAGCGNGSRVGLHPSRPGLPATTDSAGLNSAPRRARSSARRALGLPAGELPCGQSSLAA
jgi:pimeloyl-ACP methyl ester carboxylesterase